MAERPEDLSLPLSVITRIIKEVLPDGVNVSKDARMAISKAASVFVLYATSCANNFSMQHKRKTISGNDVLDAMKEMEFERFVEPLRKNLEAFKKDQQGKKEASEKRKKEREQNTSTEDENKENGGDQDEDKEEEEDAVEEEEMEEDEAED